jgi:hypothetical protein
MAEAPDGFERNENAAFSEKILDITKAHTETVIDPHGIADDFGWDRCPW